MIKHDQSTSAPVRHNRPTRINPDPMVGPDVSGNICILASDGRLFGPFKSRSEAIYWCAAQDIPCFGTYDLISPKGASS